jgi:hypothetical protein
MYKIITWFITHGSIKTEGTRISKYVANERCYLQEQKWGENLSFFSARSSVWHGRHAYQHNPCT